MSLAKQNVGFIGGGAMAEALAGGLLAGGVAAERVLVADVADTRRARLSETLGVGVTADNAEVVRRCDVVVLALKPDVITPVLTALQDDASLDLTQPLWISIAAGVPLAVLESTLSERARIVRAMPNTPALVRAGATGLCGNATAGDADLDLAQALFACVGVTWLAPEERLLDGVTGLSGSGPAYVFAFLEALIDAGTRQGLPREAAEELALQTVYGAALLARESEHSPSELRRQVSSPGGTTLAGLARLEAGAFARAIDEAVDAASRRAAELGEGAAEDAQERRSKR